MASLERRSRNGRARWYARFRDPSGAQVVKVFDRKVDAERHLATVEASKLTGSYIDAKRASITFVEFAEEHWAAHAPLSAADTTRVGKRSRLDRHILPALGRHPVGAIRPSNVAAAVGRWSQSLAPGTVGQVLRQVRQILDAAVADGLLASNPATAVRAPTAPCRREVHLTDEDVAAVLAATPPSYRPLVIALTGLGLRIGEACGLRTEDVDFLRRTVRVRQQRRPGGDLGQLKTGSSRRDIPADDMVLQALAEQIRQHPARTVSWSAAVPEGCSPSRWPVTSSTTSSGPSASPSRRTPCGTSSVRASSHRGLRRRRVALAGTLGTGDHLPRVRLPEARRRARDARGDGRLTVQDQS